MEVLITDEAGAPLEGATLHVSIWEIDDKDDFPNRDYVADAHGKMQVSLPVRLRILRIWPNKPGYVPEFLNFSEGTHDDGQLIPDKFHFKLARGTKLGGTVVDESGDPIAGVAVNVSVEVREPAWGKNPDPMISTWLTDSDFGEGSVMTDKEGRWSIDNAPGQVGAKDFEFRTKFMHPEFIRDTRWGELQGKQGVTTTQLRDASARIVLRRGIPVTGTVVDASDKPVRAGIVIWNERPYWADGTNETRLETSGLFKTIPLSPGKYPITVVAPGYRPERRIVTVDKSLEAQRFVLQPGKRLIMKVVDTPEPTTRGSIFGTGRRTMR
jgi:hypothetical protein